MANELVKIEQALATLDETVVKISSFALATKRTFAQCLTLSLAAQQIEAALTDDVMRMAFLPLKDKEWGFRTDEMARAQKNKPPYSMQTMRECMVMAVLADAVPAGNELNILAGRTYLTLNYFRRKLKEFPGLTDLVLKPGKIQWVQSGALVDYSATWKLSGKEMSIDRSGPSALPIRVNEGMGADAVLGKAERKIRAAIYKTITGSEHEDGDVGDTDIGDLKSVEGSTVESVAAQAPAPQTNKRTEQAKELLRQNAKRRDAVQQEAPATTVNAPVVPPAPPPMVPLVTPPVQRAVAPPKATVVPPPPPPAASNDGVPSEEEMDANAPWVSGEESAAEPAAALKANIVVAKTGRRKSDQSLFVLADGDGMEYLTRDSKLAYQGRALVGKPSIAEWTEADGVRTLVSITGVAAPPAPEAEPAAPATKPAPKAPPDTAAAAPKPTTRAKKPAATPAPAPAVVAAPPAPAVAAVPQEKRKIEEATCQVANVVKIMRGAQALFRMKDERNTAYFTADENVGNKIVQCRDRKQKVAVNYYEENDEYIITDLQPVEAAAADGTLQQPPEASL